MSSNINEWFFTRKILEAFDNKLLPNEDLVFFNEDFNNKVTFIAKQRHVLSVGLDKINFDENDNFDEDDPYTVIHVKLFGWLSKFKKRKALIPNLGGW